MHRFAAAVKLLIAGVVLGCGGCASKPSPAGPADTAQFKSLVVLYSALAKRGQPPASEAEFKAAIKNQLQPVVAALKVDDPDKLFISDRDGKPVVVVYSPRPTGMSGDVVAYEQAGVDGKRLVGYSLGMIEEVDEARFHELVPDGTGAAKK